ncbi:hypothetical protein THERMOS_884 [Bathymodiolus thermophilus thioautotrophic gill symbiont]|uniref:Uncharacterized protein n=1 Tax=Bathymodiolus thermophilus thioautotrophic gill symbiont TaxID=2360 RepID=A0A8H9CH82_9GAMM|nr:hypothetical protein THERMOS_884 [Bathymodiolus thermophilus thioautotrophic gill symbiont]
MPALTHENAKIKNIMRDLCINMNNWQKSKLLTIVHKFMQKSPLSGYFQNYNCKQS